MAFTASTTTPVFLVLMAAAAVTGAVADFSTNAICVRKNCINPVVPGMGDLIQLETLDYVCESNDDVKEYMQFCGEAVDWKVAVANSSTESSSLEEQVAAQDNAAATMFFYHLNGLGMEPWLYRTPSESVDPCVQTVWKMVCATYFPRAESGCVSGSATAYLRPCKNACMNYLRACSVNCCDESVLCVYNATVTLPDGTKEIVSGYDNNSGPSTLCTGGVVVVRVALSVWFAFLLALFR